MNIERKTNFATLTGSALLSVVTLGLLARYASGDPISLQWEIFRWHDYRFTFGLLGDGPGLVFLSVAALLGGLVVRFSHTYMHREPGHGRFFSTLSVFLLGIFILSLASNLDTLFLGWELVGISSFLLIGFYRHRVSSLRNAQKVYAIYRLCDVGLLVGAYLEHTGHGGGEGRLLIISILILLSAAGKSAQFPFSFWLPRAMEGPTPSSAIFYGALSIHAGTLLLFRTTQIWQSSLYAPWLVGGIGFITALVCTASSRAQSTIKGQIAYASAAQVGLMFVEMALGYQNLALLHFVGNACLRCYQLLVSPSVVVYLLKLQGSIGRKIEKSVSGRLRSTLYAFASSEAYLEAICRTLFWSGPTLTSNWISRFPVFAYFGIPLLAALAGGVTYALLASAGVAALQALNRRNAAHRTWELTSLASLLLSIGVSYGGANGSWMIVVPFAAGIIACFGLGRIGIHMKSPGLSFASLLGLTGFPISPVFFGEDLLLHSAVQIHTSVAILFSAVFIINGISLIRAFSRNFFKGI